MAGDRQPGRAAIGTVLAARIYGGTIVREGVQDRDDNETRFAWLAREGERRDAPLERAGGSAWRTSVLFWGSGRGAPGLARALPGGVRRARHQPDQDRVAAPPRAASATTCSSPTSQARRRGPGGAGARRAWRALRRGAGAGQLSGARVSRVGVLARGRGRPARLAAGEWRAQSHQSRWGPCRPRAPAARTCLIADDGDGWSGARPERDVSSRSTCARCVARWCCC